MQQPKRHPAELTFVRYEASVKEGSHQPFAAQASVRISSDGGSADKAAVAISLASDRFFAASVVRGLAQGYPNRHRLP